MKRKLQYGYGTTVDERYDRIYGTRVRRVMAEVLLNVFLCAVVFGAFVGIVSAIHWLAK